MVELADIFRQYGPQYRQEYGPRMLPSHRRALRDIVQCRTETLGGHVYSCPGCDETVYSYHSCGNRHCPKCQQDAGQQWLARQQDLLLPVPHFLLTFTLPAGLREVARRHQKQIYHLLFQTSAAATQELAQDPRFVGGRIGMVGVLQTWTRDLHFHPHVHYLVPAGGISPQGQWVRARNHFFVHVKPLSILFRAKFREALRQTEWFTAVPPEVWTQDWVVHCQPVGTGVAALKYLAPYIFRVAISNRRLLRLAEDQVTFSYKDGHQGRRKSCTLPVHEFMRRFLQHVLPKGFVKVRYFGYLSSSQRQVLRQIRQGLAASSEGSSADKSSPPALEVTSPPSLLRCPRCGQVMTRIQTIRPRSRCPPSLEPQLL
jgi:hypothetical protein